MPKHAQTSQAEYVDTPQALEQLCHKLRHADVIAVDTEFIREKTYFARLCLLQVASRDCVACIDPLALDNLDALLEIFYAKDKLILLHAARQDLEIFHDLWGRVPTPVFDTQIAAALLGYNDQIGYAKLVENMLGVQLDKTAVRTDWSQRPLSEKQLAYAADDVRYLLQLYPLIQQQLRQRNRLDWLTEDFAELGQAALYEKDPADSWKRVSGHGKLKPQQLAILQKLAAWREIKARKRDKPRKWILADDLLLSLARQAPTSVEKLAKIRGFSAALVKNHGEELIQEIQAALALPKEEWPATAAYQRPTLEEECLVDILMTYLKTLAAENQISPASLTTRKEIEKLVRGERDLPLLHGWRAHIAGQPLLDMLAGRISLRVEQGRLCANRLESDQDGQV